MESPITNKVKKLPIKVMLSFLIMTEVLFFIAPQNWRINNYELVTLFFLVVNVALWLGYNAGIKSRRANRPSGSVNLNIVKWIILLSVPAMMFQIYSSFGTVSLSSVAASVRAGLSDAGEAYYGRSGGGDGGGVNMFNFMINMLFSPLVFCSFTMGVYYFKKLEKKIRIVLIFLIALELSRWFAIGVRKGVMDMIIIISAAYIAGNSQLINNRVLFGKIKLGVGIMVGLFVAYFLISNLSRHAQDSFVDAAASYNVTGFYQNLPRAMVYPLYSICSYLCQGYYALAKALEVGFIYPDLLATNFFTINVAERFGLNPIENSYISILYNRFNIDPFVNWHSIYVWLANGFTFWGVPVFIYMVGYLFGKMWIHVVRGNSLIAVPFFVILTQMIFYFFANNQIFSFSFPVIAVLIFLYYVKIRI